MDGFLWFGADVEVGCSSNGGPQTSSNLLTFQETNGGAYDFSDKPIVHSSLQRIKSRLWNFLSWPTGKGSFYR